MLKAMVKHLLRKPRFDRIMRCLDVGITSYVSLSEFRHSHARVVELQNELRKCKDNLRFVASSCNHPISNFPDIFEKSKSQISQDIAALVFSDFKYNGYFVEFGATNGINLSNTFLLEKEFSWSGILVEPARIWHSDLRRNRPNAIIENMCVWSKSFEEIDFVEHSVPELSGVEMRLFDQFGDSPSLSHQGYKVQTISLNDLLLKHGAPNEIDFLSVDTEGSEFEILNAVDFDKYKFTFICCEHNFGPDRIMVQNLLIEKGYRLVHGNISQFDDWFVYSGE